MPFEVDTEVDCANCPYGQCVSYNPKGREDRNPRFTLHKHIGWTCAYDSFVPGFEGDKYDEDYDFYVEQMITNARKAGRYLLGEGVFNETFEKAGKEVPDTGEFQFTASGVGQVRGDTYEVLVRAGLWNCSAYWNQYLETGDWPLDRAEPDVDTDEKICIFTLGDQYDIKDLFAPKYRSLYLQIEDELADQGAVFKFSKPDALIVRATNLPSDAQDEFSKPITTINEDNKNLIEEATDLVEGHIRPQDVVAAAAIKTSGRADRNYQVVFEANAWNSLFRDIFEVNKRPYYLVIPGFYGSDVQKSVNTAWLPSIKYGDDGITAEAAIESDVLVESPDDALDWFYQEILPSVATIPSDDFNEELFEKVGLEFQSNVDEYESG